MIYDIETNIVCIEISSGKITYAKKFGNFIIHLSKSNKPILIEILNASKFIGQFDKIKNINLNNIKKLYLNN